MVSINDIRSEIDKVTVFDKMYEEMRVVDPVNKKVINYGTTGAADNSEYCFHLWPKQEICKNCISMRAYYENDTIIKIEYTDDKIFMVTAIPLELRENRVVVELLQNVTKSMILDDTKLSDRIELKKLLDKANAAVAADELTEAYNKRYIMEKLPSEIVKAFLENEPLSVVIADLDFFKRINDTYGHLAGDYILKEFAKILQNNIRQEKDWVGRFGGEEFLVCLPNTDKKMALVIAERMRKSLEEEVFRYNDLEIKLTSSFGVCKIQKDEIYNYDLLIECADKNLYKAKHAGRNCVIG
jgi:two-component system, cell cycle response regulator